MSDFTSCSNLNQFSRANTWTTSGFFAPSATAAHQFGPKGICSTLRRLCWVNAATVGIQKMALCVERLSQPENVTITDDILGLKFCRTHADEYGGACEI